MRSSKDILGFFLTFTPYPLIFLSLFTVYCFSIMHLSEFINLPITSPSYTVVCILAILYAVLIIFMTVSRDKALKTPFYRIWIIDGIASVVTVMTNLITKNHFWPPEQAQLYIWNQFVNYNGALGMPVGKVLCLINTWSMLRKSESVNADDWSFRTVALALAGLGTIDCAASSLMWFGGARLEERNGVCQVQELANNISIVMKIVSISWYSTFIIVSTIFNILCIIRIRRLAKLVGSGAQRSILRKQIQLVCYGIADSISFGAKGIQQIGVLITASLGDNALNLIWNNFYIYSNSCAAYGAPVFLLIFSATARRAITPRWLQRSRERTFSLVSKFPSKDAT